MPFEVLDLIFDPADELVQKRKLILGETTREEFHLEKFTQIAQALCATGKLTDSNTIVENH